MQDLAEGTEYVTKPALDKLSGAISTRIDELYRQIQSVMQSTTDARKESLDAAARLVDEKLQHERQQRKTEIADLRQEIQAMGHDTKIALNDIDTKLDETMRGIASINGAMQGIQDSFKVRDDRSLEVTRRLDGRIDEQLVTTKALRADADLLTSAQVSTSATLRQLTNTIHGNPDNKDDAPSLFSALRDLKGQVEAGFATVGNNHIALQTSMAHNALAIADLRQARERDKEIWAERLKIVTGLGDFGKKVLESRIGVAVITALVGAIIVGIFPELRQTLVNMIQAGLNPPVQPGG